MSVRASVSFILFVYRHFEIANKADVIRVIWTRNGCYLQLSIFVAISLTYFEVSESFCASKMCLFCCRINGVSSFSISVVGGADGGVSSDICGMVAEPVVQTVAGRRTHKTKLAANMVMSGCDFAPR